MSNRITLNRQGSPTDPGAKWFVLRDRTGHIRDWCWAKGKVEARHQFAADRPKGFKPGTTIHEGSPVEI